MQIEIDYFCVFTSWQSNNINFFCKHIIQLPENTTNYALGYSRSLPDHYFFPPLLQDKQNWTTTTRLTYWDFSSWTGVALENRKVFSLASLFPTNCTYNWKPRSTGSTLSRCENNFQQHTFRSPETEQNKHALCKKLSQITVLNYICKFKCH